MFKIALNWNKHQCKVGNKSEHKKCLFLLFICKQSYTKHSVMHFAVHKMNRHICKIVWTFCEFLCLWENKMDWKFQEVEYRECIHFIMQWSKYLISMLKSALQDSYYQYYFGQTSKMNHWNDRYQIQANVFRTCFITYLITLQFYVTC